MVDVFISYSRANQALVRQLAEAVKAQGYSLWWDDELPPHLSYGDVITEKIGAAKAAIVVWSESAAASEWVRAEADVARGQKKLIQTSIDDRMPPMPFNQIQFASIGDWRGEDDHPGWKKVKASLAALCGAPPAGTTQAHPMPTTPPPTMRTAPPPPASPAGAKSYLLPALVALGLLALVLAGGLLWLNRDRSEGDGAAGAADANAAAPAADAAARPPRTDARFTLAATIDDPDGFTNVRSGASEQAFIVGRVDRGEIFTTFPQQGEWWQVRLADGRTGYMARSRIRVIEPGDAAPPTRANEEAVLAASDLPDGPGELLPGSGSRLLTEEDLDDMSKAELFIARNEIFARRGRVFRSPVLRRHFERFPWYRPQEGEIRLSPVEIANVRLIREEERER